MTPPRPLVLIIILDGWGYAPPSNANAISLARKLNCDRLLAEFPNTLIHTSGRYIGLPTGQMATARLALQDIAPTMPRILGIPQPKEMTGHDLRVTVETQAKR